MTLPDVVARGASRTDEPGQKNRGHEVVRRIIQGRRRTMNRPMNARSEQLTNITRRHFLRDASGGLGFERNRLLVAEQVGKPVLELAGAGEHGHFRHAFGALALVARHGFHPRQQVVGKLASEHHGASGVVKVRVLLELKRELGQPLVRLLVLGEVKRGLGVWKVLQS